MKEPEFIEVFERPKFPYMVKDFTTALLEWGKSGFKYVTPEKYEERHKICEGCNFWDKEAFMGTGRCKKCGCSTRMKLSLATSKCPINLWGREITQEALDELTAQ